MIANYHTHTWRCGHAEGGERDYAAAAAQAGFAILGFSDHTPYDFFDAQPRNRPIRMKPEELAGYVSSVRALAEEYRGRMGIFAGVEAEYYPKYFPRLLELLRENGVEYMILGQHFLRNEIDGPYSGLLTDEEAVLEQYVAQVLEALDTGLFSYVAHPDLIHYTGSDAVYARHMRRLCRAAGAYKTPLEINLLGLQTGRHYPDRRFWKIAAEEGCAVILGCDAHQPEQLLDRGSMENGLRFAQSFGLTPIQTLALRSI